uniref:vacuolar cation/proton exchanger 3-like n=1 Tax=Erigeron canadensis TaxID=72917 RepID=UPI001CB92E3D|nr:vacuolar cation/proton exchanger 3-like [Erigeron canadensis]
MIIQNTNVRETKLTNILMASSEPWLLENGSEKRLTKETRHGHGHSRTAHNKSASSLRRKSDRSLVSKVPCSTLRNLLANVQEVILGTKLCILFIAIPFAIAAQYFGFARPWVFSLSLLGLIPLAERVSFLTEQIAYYTGPTVGGLLNATCGNATELIIAIFALMENKVDVVKYSLLGSILSNLLLVLGTSLLCGGIANMSVEQKFDRKQADVNIALLLLGLLCHVSPLMYRYASAINDTTSATDVLNTTKAILNLSRTSCVVMLIAYFAYIVFQLLTHRHIFETQEEDNEDGSEDETPVIGYWSGLIWLIGMTAIISLLSEYLVDTIEEASTSWGISVSFISIIVLPIVGNAAEHAGAVIFAFKNKLDITLGVALGSATQIAVFVVPMSVVVAWIIGIKMDLDFNLLETGSLALTIIATSFTLQDGTSHYLKGVVLLLCYFVIGASFFVQISPTVPGDNALNMRFKSTNQGIFRV